MKSKIAKFDITHLIKKKRACNLCLGNIKHIPVVLTVEKDDTSPLHMPIGTVVSDGIVYDCLDGKFYIEAQIYSTCHSDITIEEFEFDYNESGNVMNIVSFLAFD